MADSRPWSKQPGPRTLLLVILLAGLLVTGNFLSADDAGKKPDQPAQPAAANPTAPTVKKTKTPPPVLLDARIPPGVKPPQPMLAEPRSGPVRMPFRFDFKPDTPLHELLPVAPKTATKPVFIDDISQVPEVAFQEPVAKTPEAMKNTAHTLAKINHLNRKKTDGFMEALVSKRPDLAGLPLAMGDSCRMKGDRTELFSQALNLIKQARGQGVRPAIQVHGGIMPDNKTPAVAQPSTTPQPVPTPSVPTPTAPALPVPVQPISPQPVLEGRGGVLVPVQTQQGDRLVQTFVSVATASGNASVTDPDVFWEQFRKLAAQEDKANSKLDQAQQEHVTLARIAALMQVLAPDSVRMRKGLVKYLAGTSHAEATRALAKLAIFSAEDDVRNPAIDALKVRREKDYTEILLKGLRYPLPAVAKRATEAMVKLERADLVPQLVSFLEEPDPRAPAVKEIGDKKVPVMRELVRINHHRNCVLCHSPAVQSEVPAQVTTAEVPRPNEPLPSPSEGYDNSNPDLLVRLDVTYLRQDFSLLQPVADATPWPEMQRFDFLVRTRVLTEQEAAALAQKTGVLSPYQRAALAALRELTGRDTAPTPAAWRELLKL